MMELTCAYCGATSYVSSNTIQYKCEECGSLLEPVRMNLGDIGPAVKSMSIFLFGAATGVGGWWIYEQLSKPTGESKRAK